MEQESIAKEIVQKLHQHNFVAYFCGGCVRDKLLQKSPKDYDIVTNAHPNQIKEIFVHTYEVGAKFGIICVKYKKNFFEIATFRKDGKYLDGRRPNTVEFSDDKEDAYRRDFTINGLFYDPVQEKVIDYVGGQEDIKRKIIKTIGSPEERFSEDYLRLIRAIRFGSQLNFEICPQTWMVIKQKASCIGNVSKERIREELLSMLKGLNPKRAINLLIESGIWAEVFAEIKIDRELLEWMSKIFEYSPQITRDDVAMATLFLYPSIKIKSSEIISSIMKNLTFANNICDFTIDVLVDYNVIFEITKLNIADLKRFLRKKYFLNILELHYLDCKVRQLDFTNYNFAKESFETYQNNFFPKKILDGNQLKTIGIPPGPIYKEILYDIESQQLSGNLNSYDEAVLYVQNFYGNRFK